MKRGFMPMSQKNLGSSYYFHTMEGKGGKLKSSSEYLRAFDLKALHGTWKKTLYGDKKINFKRAVLHANDVKENILRSFVHSIMHNGIAYNNNDNRMCMSSTEAAMDCVIEQFREFLNIKPRRALSVYIYIKRNLDQLHSHVRFVKNACLSK